MDGEVAFDTIFPGHYAGRATHEHVVSHIGATVQPNGTYTGGTVSHLSQLFFDQSLINAIEATSPYNTNTIPRTANNADLFTGYAATAAYDPFPEYIMLGMVCRVVCSSGSRWGSTRRRIGRIVGVMIIPTLQRMDRGNSA